MPTRPDDDELDDRKAAILRSVVTGYVETAQPVGSSQVAHDPVIEVSPATVRADMAALEREGYLTHPHTSAGRIPTDKGYRFFVDHLGLPQPLAACRARAGTGLLLEGTRRARAGAPGHLAPARPAHRLRRSRRKPGSPGARSSLSPDRKTLAAHRDGRSGPLERRGGKAHDRPARRRPGRRVVGHRASRCNSVCPVAPSGLSLPRRAVASRTSTTWSWSACVPSKTGSRLEATTRSSSVAPRIWRNVSMR